MCECECVCDCYDGASESSGGVYVSDTPNFFIDLLKEKIVEHSV